VRDNSENAREDSQAQPSQSPAQKTYASTVASPTRRDPSKAPHKTEANPTEQSKGGTRDSTLTPTPLKSGRQEKEEKEEGPKGTNQTTSTKTGMSQQDQSSTSSKPAETMKITLALWNVCGLHDHAKRGKVVKFARNLKADALIATETHLTEEDNKGMFNLQEACSEHTFDSKRDGVMMLALNRPRLRQNYQS
jgi:hypothetical protein